MPHFKGTSGIDWFFHSEGKGPHLLFIHGWSVDHRIWRQQMKHLSDDFTVISLDLPGHGQSGPAKNMTLDVVARDIRDILDHQQIKSLHIVGSSLGGNIALKLYESNPKLVKSLALIGTMPKFYACDDYPCGISLERKEKLLRQMFHSYPSVVHVFFRSLFTVQERQTRRYKWLQTFHQADLIPAKEVLIDYLMMMEEIDQRKLLSAVKCPLLFINGAGDEICDLKTVGYMKGILKRAHFESMPELGHFPFLSSPQEFNVILKTFLKQTQRSLMYGLWF